MIPFLFAMSLALGADPPRTDLPAASDIVGLESDLALRRAVASQGGQVTGNFGLRLRKLDCRPDGEQAATCNYEIKSRDSRWAVYGWERQTRRFVRDPASQRWRIDPPPSLD